MIREISPSCFEVKVAGRHGFFASGPRAAQWGLQLLSGEPYRPIPREGEV